MLKIKKDGYEISQADNGHVMICKDNKMLFHANCNNKMDKQELEKQLDFYFILIKGLEEGE